MIASKSSRAAVEVREIAGIAGEEISPIGLTLPLAQRVHALRKHKARRILRDDLVLARHHGVKGDVATAPITMARATITAKPATIFWPNVQ